MLDYEKGKAFLKSLTEPCMIYHADSDGLCSAVLVARFLGKEGIKTSFISPNDGPGIEVSKQLMEEISSSTSAVFLDFQVDSLGIIEKLKCEKVFVLDHHIPAKDLNEANVLHMNSRFDHPDSYFPTSYLAYHLLLPESKGLEWISLVGITGDRGFGECKDVMKKVREQYPELLPSLGYDDVLKGAFGVISELIESAKAVKGLEGIRRAFPVFLEANEPRGVMDSFLMRWREDFRNELSRLEADFEESAEHYKPTDSYVYFIGSKYHISSFLSNVLADRYPGAVIFIIKKGGGLKVSARCQSGRVNVAKLLEEVSRGIGRGGGHPKAAGAYIPLKEDEFLNRLRERLQKDSL